MSRPRLLIEFPADDFERAQRFWSGLLGVELAPRDPAQGQGRQAGIGDAAIGIHERGRGPGDTAALPYLTVQDMDEAVQRVTAHGGSVIHRGSDWTVCRDSEGSPFGLGLDTRPR